MHKVKDNSFIKSLVFQHLEQMKMSNEQFCHLFTKLSEDSGLVLFGGAVRDIVDGIAPRDYDFVVNTKSENLEKNLSGLPYKKNSFGGYKLVLSDCALDIWALEDTWAFRASHLKPGIANLKDTVFLNIDSILVELKYGDVFSDGYIEALAKNTLDIVLEDNPLPSLCVLRSFVFQVKKHMKLSDNLNAYIKNWADNVTNPIAEIMSAQSKHYGREILSESILKENLSRVA